MWNCLYRWTSFTRNTLASENNHQSYIHISWNKKRKFGEQREKPNLCNWQLVHGWELSYSKQYKHALRLWADGNLLQFLDENGQTEDGRSKLRCIVYSRKLSTASAKLLPQSTKFVLKKGTKEKAQKIHFRNLFCVPQHRKRSCLYLERQVCSVAVFLRKMETKQMVKNEEQRKSHSQIAALFWSPL